jgi:hypothetical protein
MRSKRPRRVLAALLSLGLYSSVAFAWTADAPFRVMVHGHVFDRAVIKSSDCMLDVALYFTAPGDLYSSPEPKKNHFRFHAQLKFDSGQKPTTPVFVNHGHGYRVYRTRIDTSSGGCWATAERKLYQVDVEGCRGRRCTPEPFE